MKKIIFTVELLLILLFVGIGCFRNQATMVEMQGYTLEESTILAECPVSPGVYRVFVEAQIPEGGNIEFNIVPGSATKFRGLLQNAVNMRAGQRELSYEFYVTATHERIQLSGGVQEGAPTAEIVSLKIVKTNLGFFMLAVITLIASVALNLLLHFYRLVREKKISVPDQVVVWVLLGCVLLTSAPLLSDAMSIMGNTPYYLMRIEGIKQGYQISLIYGDLLLLPAVFLRICGFSMMESYRMFIIGLQIVTAVVAYLSFKKCVNRPYGALFGTILYLLAPYRIYSFYESGNHGVCMGMAFLPMVICGIYLLFHKDKTKENCASYKNYLVVGFICLLQSLLPMNLEMKGVELAGLIIPICFWVIWKKTKGVDARQRWAVFFSIIVLVMAVYHVNSIIYHTPVTYLHTAEHLTTTAEYYNE